jgi:hypothetical protein
MCKIAGFRTLKVQRVMFIFLLCSLATVRVLPAQSGDTETGELAAFGGGTFGLGGVQPAVGASTGLAFSRYGLGLFEVAFSPLGNDTVGRRTGPPAQSSHLFDLNASFHVRVPVRERWAPYGIFGAGFLMNTFKVISTAPGPIDPETGQPTHPGGLVAAIDEFKFAFHTGAGVRYHISPDWGIRPELKVIVSSRTYTRFTIGIFYNVPPGWPW